MATNGKGMDNKEHMQAYGKKHTDYTTHKMPTLPHGMENKNKMVA